TGGDRVAAIRRADDVAHRTAVGRKGVFRLDADGIPKLRGAVMTGGKDVTPIRRKGDARDRLLVATEVLVPAGFRVPERDPMVKASGKQKVSLGGKNYLPGRYLMRPEAGQFFAGVEIPDRRKPVVTASGQPLAVGRKSHTACPGRRHQLAWEIVELF